MELVHLRTFLAVVEHRGFRRAARRLYLSQPAVSRQIHELERHVGVALLSRTPSGVEPTAAGVVFAARAEAVLEDYDAALRETRAEGFRGRLVIGVTPGGAGELTQPLFRHLDQSLPGVRIVGHPFELLAWTAAPPAGVDLLLVRDPILDDRVRVTTLVSERMGLAVPDHYPAAEAARLSLDEVLELPMARLSADVPSHLVEFWTLHTARRGLVADFRGEGLAGPQPVAAAVARGVGTAAATPSTLRQFGVSATTLVPFDQAPEVRIALVSRIGDNRPIVEAVHREAGYVARRIGPYVLPELADRAAWGGTPEAPPGEDDRSGDQHAAGGDQADGRAERGRHACR